MYVVLICYSSSRLSTVYLTNDAVFVVTKKIICVTLL